MHAGGRSRAVATALVTVAAVAGSALASDAAPTDLLVVVVLPLAFAVAGLLAGARRPSALAGAGLLAVGLAHLATLLLQAVAVAAEARPVVALAGGAAKATYLLGFVALLAVALALPDRDALARRSRRVLVALAVWAVLPALLGAVVAEQQRVVVLLPGYGDVVPGLGLLPAAAPVAELAAPLLASPVVCALVVAWRAWRASGATRARLRRPSLVLLVVGVAVVVEVTLGRDLPSGVADAVAVVALAAVPFSLLPTVLADEDDPRVGALVRTTVVLALVWTTVAVGYAGAATASGAGPGPRHVGAVVVVAVLGLAPLFPPVRRSLARLAERLALGPPVDGYRLLRDYGAALGGPADHAALCRRTAEVLRTALGAQWAEVQLDSGERGRAGPPGTAAALHVAVVDPTGEAVGAVRLGPRRRGPYGPRDHEAVEALARQTSMALANARLAAELAARMDELEVSRGRLAAAGDAERTRIERDLHDGTQQDLVALLSRVELARTLVELGERPGPALEELRDDVVRAIASLRRTVAGIHPPALTDLGLVAAVRQRVQDLPVGVEVHDGVGQQRLPAAVETAAYYVVVESLTNVLKHARCERVEVHLDREASTLVVRVTDDGRGGADRRRGTGLAGLHDRVSVLSGSLDVVSPVGSGTRVTARLPLP